MSRYRILLPALIATLTLPACGGEKSTESEGPEAPTALISALPSAGPAPLTVHFDGSGSMPNGGAISGYDWNFGDGTPTAVTPVVDHTYTQQGTYAAVLIVSDSEDLSDTASVQISVAAPRSD
jgi:PKD repeat protein